MGRTRPRNVLAEHASRAGFGRVVRVHRQRRDAGAILAVLWLTFLLGAVVVFGLALGGSPLWRLVVLGYAALAGLAAAWVRWGPVQGPGERQWFAVAERGLLVWSPRSTGTVSAIPWHELHVERHIRPDAVTHRLTWEDQRGERVLDVPAVSGRRALIEALELREPVPPRRVRRLVGVAAAGLAATLVVWFAAVPVALDILLGDHPDTLADLSRLCDGGRAFGRAAPYQGPGPHPVAVYPYGGNHPHYTDGGSASPAAVQLVGCGRLVGRASQSAIGVCNYAGGYTVTHYQGRFQVDVYEAQTGREVASFMIDGERNAHCADRRGFRPGSRALTFETVPAEADFAARLSTLVNGNADG